MESRLGFAEEAWATSRGPVAGACTAACAAACTAAGAAPGGRGGAEQCEYPDQRDVGGGQRVDPDGAGDLERGRFHKRNGDHGDDHGDPADSREATARRRGDEGGAEAGEPRLYLPERQSREIADAHSGDGGRDHSRAQVDIGDGRGYGEGT